MFVYKLLACLVVFFLSCFFIYLFFWQMVKRA